MVAADFDAYAKAQREVDALWADQPTWYNKTILNTARWAGSRLIARSDNMRVKSGELDGETTRTAGRNKRTGGACPEEIRAIIDGLHTDPFAVMGLHEIDGDLRSAVSFRVRKASRPKRSAESRSARWSVLIATVSLPARSIFRIGNPSFIERIAGHRNGPWSMPIVSGPCLGRWMTITSAKART